MNKLLKLHNTDVLFESTVVGGGRVSFLSELFESSNATCVLCMTSDGCNVLTHYVPRRKTMDLNTSIDALHHVRQTGFRQRMNREYYGYFEG